MQPDAAFALTLCIVCAFRVQAKGETSQWALDGIGLGWKRSMHCRVKMHAPLVIRMIVAACMLFVWSPCAERASLVCMLAARAHAREVVAGAGGVREGCPPAA